MSQPKQNTSKTIPNIKLTRSPFIGISIVCTPLLVLLSILSFLMTIDSDQYFNVFYTTLIITMILYCIVIVLRLRDFGLSGFFAIIPASPFIFILILIHILAGYLVLPFQISKCVFDLLCGVFFMIFIVSIVLLSIIPSADSNNSDK